MTPFFASKIDNTGYSQSVDLNRVQQLYQLVKHGRIQLNDFEGCSGSITTTNGAAALRASSYLMNSVSSSNLPQGSQHYACGYPTLQLQFKIPGQSNLVDMIMNP